MFPVLDKKPEGQTSPPAHNDQNVREKEKGWDERFTVAKGIPQYSPLKDRHTRSYRKQLPKKEPDELTLLKQTESLVKQDKKTYNRKKHDAITQRLELDNVQSNVRINGLIKDLEKVWLSEKIPDFYCYYFMMQLKGVSPQRLQDLLTREIRSIRNHENHYVDINKSIQAREACLIEMRRVLENLKALRRSKDDEGFDKKLQTLTEQVSHLRKLTLFVIDKIKKWRDWLLGLAQTPLKDPNSSQYVESGEQFLFLYGDDNYLLRILNDTNFLSNSILNQYLVMATKNDPFILRPLKEEKTQSNVKFMNVVDCDEQTKSRMTKALEYLASDKAEELKARLVPQKEMRETRTKPEIGRRQHRAKIKSDVNYETDLERVQQYKMLEKQRQRLDRLEKNQVRINAIKSIYEGKLPKRQLREPPVIVETDTEAIAKNTIAQANPHNQSMPRLIHKRQQRSDRTKSLLMAQSQKKLQKPKEEQSEFESILRKRELEVLKDARNPQTVKLKDRLTSKKALEDKEGLKELQKIVSNYNEQKLINNVKAMDADIKNKISMMKEEERRPPISLTVLKQNDDLIKELKTEIMSKLERENQEKERIKRQQREEESRLLEQMKLKLRKQFQERISQERAKRQAQRQELERQLREEDAKLAEQKRLEMQLTMKMNHEREVREMERIKNQTLAREKELKKKLREEQQRRIEIEKRTKQEKLELMEQINRKALRENLQAELRQELREKLKRQANEEAKAEADRVFNQNKGEIEKELEVLKIKQALQIENLRKENEARDRLLRQKLNEEERKKQQLQKLMKQRMEMQKHELQQFAIQQRQEMQRQIREGAKETLLQEMKAERMMQYDKEKREKEKQIEQEVYREKMREKLEREMRIDVIKKTKEQLEQRELKKKLISDQLERAQAKLQEQVINKPIDKGKIQTEVRKEIIEKAIVERKMEKQVAKNQLRSQFEKELLSSGLPEIYTQKPDFLLKDITAYKDDNYLKKKLEEERPVNTSLAAATGRIGGNTGIPNAVAAASANNSKQMSFSGISPIKRPPSPTVQEQLRMTTEPKSEYFKLNDSNLTNERTRLGMTEEQYEIYRKKKRAVDAMRDDQDKRIIRTIQQMEENDEYQKVRVKQQGRREDNEHRREDRRDYRQDDRREDRRDDKKDRRDDRASDKKQYRTRKSERKDDKRRKDSQDRRRRDDRDDKQEKLERRRSKKSKEGRRSPTESSEQIVRAKKKKRDSDEEIWPETKISKKRKKQESSQDDRHRQPSESEESSQERRKTKRSRISPTKHNISKRSFQTSEEETKRKKKKPKEPSSQEPQSSEPQEFVHYQRQSKHSRTPSEISRQPKQPINPTNITNLTNQRFATRLEAIEQGDLDQYIGQHFLKLPKEQLQLQCLNRHDLYRKLINEVTFSFLVGSEQGKESGLCIAYHDRNKQQSRKFVIVHISTYKSDHLFDFAIAMCTYILKKDPCDQVEFSLKFDESKEQQLEFSNDFNSQFDKFGAIFQKKLDDDVYERKYVMKRPFNLKCQVQLGAQSKHSFVNIFTLSSTLIVSNMELVQVREENVLSDTITPERELSYSIMISDVFRNALSPEEAEILKNKVKEYLKLKELLVLIVMLEKKKVKLDELKLSEFGTITELNMRLMSQGKELVRFVKDPGTAHNRIFHCQLQQAFKLPFNFQTTTLPLDDGKAIHQINYFRMAAIAPHKLYTIKSSLYNTQMHVLPTENPKFKLFLMSASQYNEIKDANSIDLFMYIRVFLKNVKSHSVANWKYVWVPEMATKGYWAIREYRSFLDKDIYATDRIDINYKQFIPGTLIIQPEHKDLVITPPFIVGILSVTLEQVSEGSPLYVRLLNSDSLKAIQSEMK